jgi:ankyrin repeat protein
MVYVAGRGLAVALLFPFVIAAAEPDVQKRDQNAGSDVNAVRADGSTALLWAASRDDGETVGTLLKAGANPNKADENGETRSCSRRGTAAWL